MTGRVRVFGTLLLSGPGAPSLRVSAERGADAVCLDGPGALDGAGVARLSALAALDLADALAEAADYARCSPRRLAVARAQAPRDLWPETVCAVPDDARGGVDQDGAGWWRLVVRDGADGGRALWSGSVRAHLPARDAVVAPDPAPDAALMAAGWYRATAWRHGEPLGRCYVADLATFDPDRMYDGRAHALESVQHDDDGATALFVRHVASASALGAVASAADPGPSPAQVYYLLDLPATAAAGHPVHVELPTVTLAALPGADLSRPQAQAVAGWLRAAAGWLTTAPASDSPAPSTAA